MIIYRCYKFKILVKFLQSFSDSLLYSMVVLLHKLILIMPAINAISERSFSALRHIKNMAKKYHAAIQTKVVHDHHIHKELTDVL